MKQRLRLAFGLIVSLLFLFLAVRNLDWSELWQLFRQARLPLPDPALAPAGDHQLPARLSLAPADVSRPDLPLPQVFRYVNIGYFFNNILPAKAGRGGSRLFGGARRSPAASARPLSTLLIERLLDVLTLVVLLVVLIPFVELPAWATRGGLTFGGVAIGGTLALIVLSRFGTGAWTGSGAGGAHPGGGAPQDQGRRAEPGGRLWRADHAASSCRAS